MSENLDLVRSIYAAWERGDFSSVEWAHPEIESVRADGPLPGRWTGLTGLQTWREVIDTWEDFRFQAEEFRELDGERVLPGGVARAHVRRRGHEDPASGARPRSLSARSRSK